jgi:hypothetical protein
MTAQTNTPRYKVIAFYTGKSDKAHISFVREANRWFSGMAAERGFFEGEFYIIFKVAAASRTLSSGRRAAAAEKCLEDIAETAHVKPFETPPEEVAEPFTVMLWGITTEKSSKIGSR